MSYSWQHQTKVIMVQRRYPCCSNGASDAQRREAPFSTSGKVNIGNLHMLADVLCGNNSTELCSSDTKYVYDFFVINFIRPRTLVCLYLLIHHCFSISENLFSRLLYEKGKTGKGRLEYLL